MWFKKSCEKHVFIVFIKEKMCLVLYFKYIFWYLKYKLCVWYVCVCVCFCLKSWQRYNFKFITLEEKTSAWSIWLLLFPCVPLKLLLFPKFSRNLGTKQSATFSFASLSSFPSTQTTIEGWALVSIGSRPFLSIIHPTPTIARGFIVIEPRGKRFHFTTENPWACWKSRFEEHFDLGS